MIEAMRDYEIHWNTAATRAYGVRIIEVLKTEILSKRPESERDENWVKQVEMTFNEQRLITRDDKAKFNAGMSQEQHVETYRRAETNLASKNIPITKESLDMEVTKLNFTKKSLDALAGGDDTFFVILDDRDDVWPTEVKLFDCGVPQVVPSDNLIKIPGYFFFDDQNWRQ